MRKEKDAVEWTFLQHCRLIHIISHVLSNYIGGRRAPATLDLLWSHDERMIVLQYCWYVLRHPIMRGNDDPRHRAPAPPSAEEKKTKTPQQLAMEQSKAFEAYRQHV
jgi:hypothetical protein